MYMPTHAGIAPKGIVLQGARLPLLYTALLLIPLVLFFATPQVAYAVEGCVTDTAGANDEPGQKDLTRLCSDDSGLPATLAITWQWDQTGWTGSNTGDACALFDTDGDGNANYSLCTIVSGTPATFQQKQLYRCSDTWPDKCMGPTPIGSSSVCTAGVQGTFASPADPFPTGDDYPRDTVGACNINMVDVGGGTAELIDVCSYPSQQPNSDPSDCVIYRDNTGRLEVRKVLRPAYNPGRFNLLIDSSIEASAVGDGGTTGEKIVAAGEHTVSETTATNTNLGDYNTSTVCRDANGTGNIVAAQNNNSPLAVTVPDGSDIVCIITNERQTGTIYVTKIVDWNGIPVDQDRRFEVCIYGPSYPNGNCQTTGYDGGLLTWTGVETGYYDVIETDPGSEWSVVVDKSPVSVPCDGSVSATITNKRKLGSLEVTKFVNWNGAEPDPARSFEICISGPSYATPSCQAADHDGATLLWPNLVPGLYTVAETDPGSEWAVTISDSPVTVPIDGTTAKTAISNTLKRGILTVTKIAKWNGVNPDGSQEFTICISGPSYLGGDCQSVGHLGGALSWMELIPGDYTIVEQDAGLSWSTVVEGSPAKVVSGDTAAAAVVNTRKLGRLQVTKNVDWNGVAPSAGQFFKICIAGQSYPLGDCKTTGGNGGVLTWDNLVPGPYVVSETDPGSEWVAQVPAGAITVPGDGSSASATVTNTHKRGNLQVNKTVNWNGSTADPAQTFDICITGPSYPDGNCLSIGSAGGPLTWNDLIPGDYVVAEADAGAEWITTVTGSPAKVAGDDSTANASITNTRKRGSLNVIKVVDWKGVAPDTEQTFRICIAGPSYPSGNCQTAGYNGGALVWESLIPGEYNVSEAALGSEWSVTIAPLRVTVPADGSPVSASVVNARKLGGLNVTKVVNWNGITPNEAQAFQICISGPSFPGGDCKTADFDGDTLAWTGLIPGDYSVAERDPGSAWMVTVGSATVSVPANGGVGSTTITNTRKRGGLTVTKAVNWNGITPDQAKSFQLCIAGPSFPTGDCKTVDFDGGALNWDNLLPGSYSVSEKDPGTEWTVQVTGSPTSVAADGTGGAASVLNTRKLGSLKVTKTVDWNGVQPKLDQTFTICIAGPTYTNGDCKSVGPYGGVLTWTGLIPGIYEVAENNPGRVWVVAAEGSPVTVPADGGLAGATIVNTRLQPASVTVTKIVTQSATVGWTFLMRLSGVAPKTVTENNPTVTWEDLEPNRSYVLGEDDPGTPWEESEFTCTINNVSVGEVREGKDIELTLSPTDHALCIKYNIERGGTDLELEPEPVGRYGLYLPAVQR
jgi:hypothetical protein